MKKIKAMVERDKPASISEGDISGILSDISASKDVQALGEVLEMVGRSKSKAMKNHIYSLLIAGALDLELLAELKCIVKGSRREIQERDRRKIAPSLLPLMAAKIEQGKANVLRVTYECLDSAKMGIEKCLPSLSRNEKSDVVLVHPIDKAVKSAMIRHHAGTIVVLVEMAMRRASCGYLGPLRALVAISMQAAEEQTNNEAFRFLIGIVKNRHRLKLELLISLAEKQLLTDLGRLWKLGEALVEELLDLLVIQKIKLSSGMLGKLEKHAHGRGNLALFCRIIRDGDKKSLYEFQLAAHPTANAFFRVSAAAEQGDVERLLDLWEEFGDLFMSTLVEEHPQILESAVKRGQGVTLALFAEKNIGPWVVRAIEEVFCLGYIPAQDAAALLLNLVIPLLCAASEDVGRATEAIEGLNPERKQSQAHIQMDDVPSQVQRKTLRRISTSPEGTRKAVQDLLSSEGRVNSSIKAAIERNGVLFRGMVTLVGYAEKNAIPLHSPLKVRSEWLLDTYAALNANPPESLELKLKPEAEGPREVECKLCLEAKETFLLFSCCKYCCCLECATKYWRGCGNLQNCPVCRTPSADFCRKGS